MGMWNLHAQLILTVLQIVSVLSTGENTDVPTSSNEQPKYPILPLALILYKTGFFIRPTIITKISWVRDTRILGGGTEFSVTLAEPYHEYDKQIYTCSMGTTKKKYSKYHKQHDDEYCTYWTTFENKESEPLTCKFEPEPFVQKVNVANDPTKKQVDLSCGPENQGKMYHFVYKICIMGEPIPNSRVLKSNFTLIIQFNSIKNRDLFEIYRFCYNEDEKEIIYTTNEITSVNLLFDDNLKYEREKTFQLMSDGYKYFGTYYKEIEQDYIQLEKYQAELNAEERSSKLLYQPQKLTLDKDMEFALWRKTTFHYLNVRPMESQQAILWDHINSHIRLDALKNGRNYGMRTGVITLAENRIKKTPIKGKITPPDIWIKVIENMYLISKPEGEVGYEGIAIIMNANYGNPAADTYFNKICVKNWCKKSLESFSEQVTKTVGCCPVTSEILKFFNSNAIIRNVLKIDKLIDEDDDNADKFDKNESAGKEEQHVAKKIKLQ